ncbi:MAG: hypothetical protein IT447_16805 [Phycisphaerales bacterium]|nr:hypothetical protein [Phycisphaerales bacterium]
MKRRRLILISVGLLALCCLGAVVSSVLFPDEDATTETASIELTATVVIAEDEPAPTARATATTKPTSTTPPTAVPPTSTSAPTAVPTETAVPPTNTPDPGALTDEEAAYRDAIVEIASIYGSTITQMGELLTEVGNDVGLLLNDDWKLDMTIVLATLLFAGDEVRSLEPPELFEPLHEHWLNVAGHYDLVVEYLADGIDTFDVEKINQANEQMLAGQEDVFLAIEEIERLTAEGVDFSSP